MGDVDRHGVPCAKWRYGAAAVEAVIDGLPGYEGFTGHEGNPLSVVLSGSEDLREMCCGDCFTPLDKEDGEQWQAMIPKRDGWTMARGATS